MNLRWPRASWLCYDGCSTISGVKKPSSQTDEPRAVFTHFYGHCINLAASDSMKTSRIVKDALETTHEITRHIKYSPKRNAKLKQIRKSSEGQLQCWIWLLCPTRWTTRADATTSVISNYSVLHEWWDWSLDNCTVIEMKARIRGSRSLHTQQFEFIFGLVLDRNLLQHTDSLSVWVCKERRFLLLTV